jgi:uracil-DNA glycosylase family 4
MNDSFDAGQALDGSPDNPSGFESLNREICSCRNCPRLVEWREQIANEKRASFRSVTYWGLPVPNFGDELSSRIIVGLAPAAHGGNRTGRLFTGDRSGDWIFRALHKAGIANQAESTRIGDGLALKGAYMSPIVHCAPPQNKPTPQEIQTCSAYLRRLFALRSYAVVLCLGSLAWTEVHRLFDAKVPRFGHMAISRLPNGAAAIGCYHPSQQNTFTGRLTEAMLDEAVCLFRDFPATEPEAER